MVVIGGNLGYANIISLQESQECPHSSDRVSREDPQPISVDSAHVHADTQPAPGVEVCRICPQDLLELQLFSDPGSCCTIRVTSSGLVSLPLIGAARISVLPRSVIWRRSAPTISHILRCKKSTSFRLENQNERRLPRS